MRYFANKFSFLCIVAFLVVHTYLAYYTKDLKQLNSEYLFLNEDSIARYKNFQRQFPEKKVLIFELSVPSVIDAPLFNTFNEEIKKLRKHYESEYPDQESDDDESLLQIVTFFDIYKNVLKEERFEIIQPFLEKHQEKIQFRFIGKNYLAFLIIIHEDLSTFKIKTVIDDLKTNLFFQKYSLKIAGLPYVNYLLDYFSEEIKLKVFPIMFVFAFLLTFFFTKNIIATCIIFIPSLCSLAFTLGMIQYFFHHMNMITAIMPLLIFVINLSLGFHLFFAGVEIGTFQDAMREKWKPILLTVLTTAIGFGSLYFSHIEVIRQFAILSIFSISITTLLSIFWFSLTLKESLIQKTQQRLEYPEWKKYVSRSFSLRVIAFLCFCAILGSVSVAPKIERLTNSTEYFPKSLKIKEDLEKIQSEILGSPNFEILLFKKNQDGLNYEDLKQFVLFENKIKAQFKKEYQLLSSNTFVQEANYFYTGHEELPRFVESYYTLIAGMPPSVTRLYPTQKIYRISLLGNLINTHIYFEQLDLLQKTLEESGFAWEINGLYYNLMQTQDLLISILAWSLLGTLFVISVFVLFFFKKLKHFLVFLIINIIPLFLTSIFMYLVGLSINIATVMTFSISLGMVVDSTIHLTFVFEKNIPFNTYYKTTLVPIMTSSVLLIICFGIFGVHGFLPIRHFGLTLSFTLAMGAIFDIYVLPTLLTGKQNRIES